jgi:hypothetical protein
MSAIQYRSTARQLQNSPVTVLEFQLLYSSPQTRCKCLAGSTTEMQLFDPVKINRYIYTHIFLLLLLLLLLLFLLLPLGAEGIREMLRFTSVS